MFYSFLGLLPQKEVSLFAISLLLPHVRTKKSMREVRDFPKIILKKSAPNDTFLTNKARLFPAQSCRKQPDFISVFLYFNAPSGAE